MCGFYGSDAAGGIVFLLALSQIPVSLFLGYWSGKRYWKWQLREVDARKKSADGDSIGAGIDSV
jgi:hypothetical protein